MTTKDILQAIFRDMFDLDDLVLENTTSANDIEEWDSLAHINLVVAIEKEFNIRFSLEELQKLKNIEAMIRIIEKKLTSNDK